jgi:hypothetical protein
MIVYSVSPSDFWGGWQSPERLVEPQDEDDGMNLFASWEDWEAFWARAQNLARELGWEGEVRQGPFVAGLPNPDYAASSPPLPRAPHCHLTRYVAHFF